MKKIILLIMLSLPVLSFVRAQTVPNGNFENWTVQTLFEDPTYWSSANMQLQMMGMPSNCTKETDHYSGTFSAKLETVTNGQDSMNGIMFIGVPGNQSIEGGYPFAARPDTVIIHLKYNILPNDTGHFMVFFKNSGNVIGMVGINLIGIQSTFGEFKLPVSWFQLGNADTLSALVTSSNLDSPVVPGSYVYVDGIEFINSTVPFPNGDFENWMPNTSEEPDGWVTLNYAKTTVPSATKDVDHYDGNYAIRVETIQTIWGQQLGYITNGIIGNDGPEGGVPISLNPSTLTGFYKYVPNGLDTAIAVVMTTRHDIVLDSTIVLDMVAIKLPPTNTYMPFTINLNYNNFPFADTINISFASSNLMDSGAYVGLGSALYIDSLNLNFLPVSVENKTEDDVINIFPNPVKDYVSIALSAELAYSSIRIFDALGRILYDSDVKAFEKLLKVDVSQFDSGLYFIELKSNDGNCYKTKFLINR